MPPNPAPHITDWLTDIGIVGSDGMGAVPLSWGEIAAWQHNMALALEPWERRLLRRLSVAYVIEGRRAESESCPAPWRIRMTRRHREIEEAELRNLLG